MANLYNSHLFPPPALTIDFAGQDFRGYGVAGRSFEDLISFTRAGATAWTRRADGKFYAAAENAPRWGEWAYNTTTGLLEPAGLLIEGARTNLCLQSHRVDGLSPWALSGSPVLSSAGLNPLFVGKTPYKFTNDGAGSDRFAWQGIGALGSSPVTLSAIVENIDAATTYLQLRDNAAGGAVIVGTFTWTSGAFSGSVDKGTAGAWSAVKLSDVGPNGGKVYQLSVTATPSNAANLGYVRLYATGATTNALSAIIHHAQFEVASFPSSPILTDAAQVTRAADVATVATAGWFADGQAGTLLADFVLPVVSNAVGQRVITLDNGASSSNRIGLKRDTDGSFYATMTTGGATQVAFGSAMAASGSYKAAVAWNTNDIALYRGGVSVGTDATATLPVGLSVLQLGASYSAGEAIFGHLRSLRYWPRRLSNTIIQALTA
jgi:hypothetical protein